MFSFFKKKKKSDPRQRRPMAKGPLKLVRFSETKMAAAQEQLTDGYVATGAFGIPDLLKTYHKLQSEHENMKVVTSLDDFQASYTSYHAAERYGLNDTGEVDVSIMPADRFDETGEYLGEMNTPEEFPIREANFRRQLVTMSFDEVSARLRTNTELTLWDEYWKDVSTYAKKLDGISVFNLAPVRHAYETLIAFPNGYFGPDDPEGDLNPFENHELARHLEERAGLTLFGIGSAYLAFTWDGDVTDTMLDTLTSICAIPDDAGFRSKLKADMAKRGYVLVTYHGS